MTLGSCLLEHQQGLLGSWGRGNQRSCRGTSGHCGGVNARTGKQLIFCSIPQASSPHKADTVPTGNRETFRAQPQEHESEPGRVDSGAGASCSPRTGAPPVCSTHPAHIPVQGVVGHSRITGPLWYEPITAEKQNSGLQVSCDSTISRLVVLMLLFPTATGVASSDAGTKAIASVIKSWPISRDAVRHNPECT